MESIAQVGLKQLLDSAAVAKYLARIFFPEPKRGNGVLLGGEANIANSVFAVDFWVGVPPGRVTMGLSRSCHGSGNVQNLGWGEGWG